jgi:regulator of replication initiation timing
MQYSPITALLVEAFKEQHRQIEEYRQNTEMLKSYIQEILKKNVELQGEIDAIKSTLSKENK